MDASAETRNALVVGVANERSIAWGIACALHREGVRVALSCQNQRLSRRVQQRLAARLDEAPVLECDLADDTQVAALAERLRKDWGRLDILIHSVAYSPRELLDGGYLEHLERDAFLQTMDASVHSFTALTRQVALPLMDRGGALLTLSYLGAERVVPNYNAMGVAKAALEASVRYMAAELGPRGIRVNALSPGPVRTLAASGISGLRDIFEHVKRTAPLRRNVTLQDIGYAAAFLCSEHAAAITGQVIYADCGYSIMAPLPG